MCVGIYLALIGLFLFYSDFVINQYVLSVPAGEQGMMAVAVGWEMVWPLWPVVIAAMLLASAASVWATRRCLSCSTGVRRD